MAWAPPSLDNPAYNPETKKAQHRLRVAYSKASQAIELGVLETGIFDGPTDQSIRNIQGLKDRLYPNGIPVTGKLDWATKKRIGILPTAAAAPTKRFVQQGVGFSTDAFLMGDPTHSYDNACDEGVAELNNLTRFSFGPKVIIGYSMGDDIVDQWLHQWPSDRRHEIEMVVGFGSPSRPPGPTLLGNNPPGAGISGLYTPDWARDRTYQFIQDGDMYACAVGVLPQLYDILTKAELSIDFAMFLFQMLSSSFGPILLGTIGSIIPGAGALAQLLPLISGGAGLLGGIVPGVGSATTEPAPNLIAMITNIGGIVQALMAALQFVSTNAHFRYHDQPQPFWRGLTAVDCAAQIITEKVDRATVYTVPGTVAHWNDGPPAWTAWKLP